MQHLAFSAENFSPTRYRLDPSVVTVWYASLEQPQVVIDTYSQFLSNDELTRANSFAFDRDRNNYIFGRGMVRKQIAHITEQLPAEVEFAYGDQGKPFLPNHPMLHFNVSHSGQRVVLAVAFDRQVGVDIEYKGNRINMDRIVERFFSARERYIYHQLPQKQRTQAFYNGWTRKEAYIKAIGLGLSCSLQDFDVSIRNSAPAQLLGVRHPNTSAAHWSMENLEISSHSYAAALVAEGQGWRSVCHQWHANGVVPC